MPTIDDRSMTRVCIRLFSEDYDYFRELDAAAGGKGVNFFIRQVLHKYAVHLRDIERLKHDREAVLATFEIPLEIPLEVP